MAIPKEDNNNNINNNMGNQKNNHKKIISNNGNNSSNPQIPAFRGNWELLWACSWLQLCWGDMVLNPNMPCLTSARKHFSDLCMDRTCCFLPILYIVFSFFRMEQDMIACEYYVFKHTRVNTSSRPEAKQISLCKHFTNSFGNSETLSTISWLNHMTFQGSLLGLLLAI